MIYWLIFVLFGELFATQSLHQEHNTPYQHRSEDGEEDDGEPQGCLGDETGQFVHERFVCVNKFLCKSTIISDAKQ